MKSKTLLIIAIGMFALPLIADLLGPQWILYYDKAIKGSVIDAETRKVVEGAVVVGMWPLVQVPGEGSGGYAKVSLTLTDKDGKFKIPFWIRYKPWKFNSVVDELAPKVIIYKPGYKLFWKVKDVRESGILNPVKLNIAYTDEEVWENHKEFRSQTRFYRYFSKNQRKEALYAIKEGTAQLTLGKAKEKLFKDIDEDYQYWIGGKK